jgi:hypothetical protein
MLELSKSWALMDSKLPTKSVSLLTCGLCWIQGVNDGQDGEEAILDCDLWKLHGNLSQVSLTETDLHFICCFCPVSRGGRSCLV